MKFTQDPIPHAYSEEMSEKSSIHILPVSLNNEASYSDCIKIMDEYVEQLNRWYTKAGRGAELSTLQVPVGRDQLTRVRLQGAKSLRDGANTATERFDQLHPIIVELFHTVKDFLEKLCKKFLQVGNGSDQGTLGHLRVQLQRVNVNGKVKGRFKAHDDFVVTTGLAYFLSYVLKHFNMDSLNAIPESTLIPDNIKFVHREKRESVFEAVMDEIIADLLLPFERQAYTFVYLYIL